MSWIDGVRATVRGWLLRGREDRELREEMDDHLRRDAEEHVRIGMTAGAGRREARLRFGAVDRVHEEVRDARGARVLDDLGRDVSYAVRSLRRAPGFTAAALLTIALGVGATTAIFSVVDGAVLRPLPYANGDRLVAVWGRFVPESGFDFEYFPLSGPEYVDYRAAARTMRDVAPYRTTGLTLVREEAAPQRLQATLASAHLFDVLGVTPAYGRLFTREEDVPGGPAVAVLGHALWRTTFAADPAVLGTTVRLNGVATEIVGVLPPDVAFPTSAQALYLPLRFDAADPGHRSSHGLSAAGILAPGATLADAEREVDVLMARWKAEYPDVHTGHFLVLRRFIDDVLGDAKPVLFVLLGAVAFVLLIVCANVANLLLARGEVRTRELAVRGALGAGRARLVRQLLTESVVLALVGGAAGAVVAWAALRPLLALGAGSIPRADDVAVDARVLGFALLATLACSILFGVIPALRAGRTAPEESLRGAGRTTAGRVRQRLRGTLVASQVALAFLLVAGAALMIRSFHELTRVDAGVDPDGVLIADLSLPAAEYEEAERVVGFTDALLERLRALPGVTSASVTSSLPLLETPGNWDFQLEGVAPPLPGQPAHSGDHVVIGPDYAAALGVRMVEGRAFDATDRADGLLVTMLNETAARTFFPNGGALGQRLRLSEDSPWLTIVGVIGDVRYASLDAEPRPAWHVPYAQSPLVGGPARGLTYVVRTAGDAAALAGGVRAVVRELDPNLPIPTLATMHEVVGDSVARPRFLTTLLVLFGALAATLGAVGLYGVLAYTVAQRGREFAIRMAVGAGRPAIFGRVLRDGLVLALAGLGAGVLLALAAVRLIESQLFGIAPRDPATFGAVAALLLVVASAACALPALRAVRTAPLEALRGDG
jgi:putative ABC transport system permease protein